jgi:hypothetical protein
MKRTACNEVQMKNKYKAKYSKAEAYISEQNNKYLEKRKW